MQQPLGDSRSNFQRIRSTWVDTALIALALMLGVVVASCSSSGEAAESGSTAEVLTELLTYVPVNESTRFYASAIDIEAAEKALGLERVDCDDPEATRNRLLGFLRKGPDTSGRLGVRAPFRWASPGMAQTHAEDWNTSFGFAPCSTTAVAMTPMGAEIYRPGPGHKTIEDAIRSDPVWSDVLTEESHAGQPFFRWSGGPPVLSGARPYGLGGNLALVGDTDVVLADDREDMEETLASIGNGIGARGAAASITETLVVEGSYSVTINLATVSLDSLAGPFDGAERRAELDEYISAWEGVSRYTALGFGVGFSDGEYFTVLVFEHRTEDRAAANLERFARLVEEENSFADPDTAWSELLSIVEGRAEGTQSIFRLGAPDGGGLDSWLLQDALEDGDNIFWPTE